MTHQWYYKMDREGETPMSRAMKCGHELLTRLLLFQETAEEPDEDVVSLHALAYFGMAGAVQQLLDKGADPRALDRHGDPPLLKAARSGHLDVIKMLVEHGAEVNETGDMGMTALHWVALNGRADIAEYLLRHGVDLNIHLRAQESLTPLSVAKLMGYEELSSMLLSYGAKY